MIPVVTCFMLLRQPVRRADSRARAKTGNKIAARIAMMAITTSSSISVNPRSRRASRMHVDLVAHDRPLDQALQLGGRGAADLQDAAERIDEHVRGYSLEPELHGVMLALIQQKRIGEMVPVAEILHVKRRVPM